jgi:hypothetical protein
MSRIDRAVLYFTFGVVIAHVLVLPIIELIF